MELGLGKMQIQPNVFWNMSFPEFYASINGFVDFHTSGSNDNSPLTREELEDLRERFPD